MSRENTRQSHELRRTLARDALSRPDALRGGVALIMQRAKPLSQAEADHLLETDGFPDWDS
jgi:hypothetical protein